MTPEQVGDLFVSLLPQLRELVRVPQDTPADDVLNTVLVELLEEADKVPDDPQEARRYIRDAVVVMSKYMLRRRTVDRDRFPPPSSWHIGDRYVGPLDEMVGEITDPIDRIPDTRPDPLREFETADYAERLGALTKGLREDTGLLGEVYRRVFLGGRDRRNDLKEIAQELGISQEAIRQRVRRVRAELKRLLATLKEGV